MKRAKEFLWAGFFGLLAQSAAACTLCDTETGAQVRAGIFGENFVSTLSGVMAPFPFLLLAVVAISRGLTRR